MEERRRERLRRRYVSTVASALALVVGLALMALADTGTLAVRPERIVDFGAGAPVDHGAGGNSLLLPATPPVARPAPAPPAVPTRTPATALVTSVRPATTTTTTTTTTVPAASETPPPTAPTTTTTAPVASSGGDDDDKPRSAHKPHKAHSPKAKKCKDPHDYGKKKGHAKQKAKKKPKPDKVRKPCEVKLRKPRKPRPVRPVRAVGEPVDDAPGRPEQEDDDATSVPGDEHRDHVSKHDEADSAAGSP